MLSAVFSTGPERGLSTERANFGRRRGGVACAAGGGWGQSYAPWCIFFGSFFVQPKKEQ